MSIYLDKNSKVFVQGITGAEGSYHTGRMLAYGTNIVGGVTPATRNMSCTGTPSVMHTEKRTPASYASSSASAAPAGGTKMH